MIRASAIGFLRTVLAIGLMGEYNDVSKDAIR